MTRNTQRKEEQRRTLTVAEAAAIVGVSVPHYYKHAAAGSVPALRVGKARIVVPREQLDAYLAGNWKRPS